MDKPLVSHEVPFCLLNESLKFNDYQYCLPHLMDENEEYKNFFLEYRKQKDSYIIMDNSLHELGKAYNTDRLWYWVNTLNPNEFIIPDVWEDKNKSIINAKTWSQTIFPENITKIAVIQALDIEEAMICYQTYKDLGYNKIAFSYGASYYNKISNHPNKDIGKALGRIQLISFLYKNNIISDKDEIHLLGCSVPSEFGWYKDMPFVKSIDTSNPIMAAIEGNKYSFGGIHKKPLTNMNSIQDIELNKIDLSLMWHNVVMFRKINNL
jgi:hypothetical protein